MNSPSSIRRVTMEFDVILILHNHKFEPTAYLLTAAYSQPLLCMTFFINVYFRNKFYDNARIIYTLGIFSFLEAGKNQRQNFVSNTICMCIPSCIGSIHHCVNMSACGASIIRIIIEDHSWKFFVVRFRL